MSRSKRPARFAAIALAGAALALSLAFASPARAEGEDEAKELDELVARLRNPLLAKHAERDLLIVQLMLRQKTEKADGYLKELLSDTGSHPTVVEQIAVATLIDSEHRLLPEVVERLRREAGSELDRAMDLPFVTYSDAALVQRLVVLARDESRPVAFRAVAVDLLGRTGNPEALDPLLDIWGGPQKDLRDPAAHAFERILPAGAVTREEAVVLREGVRNVPYAEALRRLLRRESGRAPAVPEGGDIERDYVQLATQTLPRATLQQILSSYLDSSVATIRSLGAKRIAEYPFDAADGPDGKVRAARECLSALRREDVEAVELDLLAALTALAPDLRGAVGEADLAALVERVKVARPTSNAVRLASVRLVGELRDPRSVAVMETTFASLADGDVELRLALLDALQQSPGDLTPWLIERLASESHTRVVRKLVVLLNRADDPAAIEAFRRLLASHPDQQVRWDVAKALGTLWAGRQLPAARDALMELGLVDADPIVRRTSAAALGSAGPGRDAIVERLQKAIRSDVDAKVRQAAAKSIVDLDENAAAANLAPYVGDDGEIWRLFRDRLVEDVRRREKTPDRVLAAADVLESNGLGRLAVDLLTQVAAVHDGLWENDGGRGAVCERLASLHLAEGDPDAARRVAQELLDATPRDAGEPRARAELLVATAQCRSGRQDELRVARRSLAALRSAEALPAALRASAEVELGDCLLRLADPVAARAVLAPVCARTDLGAPVAKRAAMLLEDAERRIAEERRKILEWVAAFDGAASPEAATAGLRDLGPRAAPYLLDALAEAKDAAATRRLVRAASVVVGRPLAEPADDASATDVERIVTDARAELTRVRDRAAAAGDVVK